MQKKLQHPSCFRELSALRAPIAEIERHFDEGKDVEALDLHAIENATDVFNEVSDPMICRLNVKSINWPNNSNWEPLPFVYYLLLGRTCQWVCN